MPRPLLWYAVPPFVAAAVAIAIGLLITGAFHEDGLGDVADAFGGGSTVERRLQILKDPRQGTYGVVAHLRLAARPRRLRRVDARPGGDVRRARRRRHARPRRGVALAVRMPAARYDGLGATAAGELSARAARGSRSSPPW